MPATIPQEVALEVDGVPFTVRLFPDPSGLRAQVWYGDERIAGLRLFHNADVDRLCEQARRNAAVRRAVARLSGSATKEAAQ